MPAFPTFEIAVARFSTGSNVFLSTIFGSSFYSEELGKIATPSDLRTKRFESQITILSRFGSYEIDEISCGFSKLSCNLSIVSVYEVTDHSNRT